MAKVITLNIAGSLGAEGIPYDSIIEGVSYLLSGKASYEAKLAAGEESYPWEVPPDIILVTMDSSGGDINKLYTAMQSLKNLSKVYPTVGLVTGTACSAGYMLLSSCPHIIVLPGANIGSLAAAAAYIDSSESSKKKGLKSFFFSTHNGKFTGLPGENLSDAEIEAYLKTSTEAYFSVIAKTLEVNRPGISEEIKKLNGSTFIVTGEETSPLFDSMASSYEEVYYTLKGIDMNKTISFSSLFGGDMQVKPAEITTTGQVAGAGQALKTGTLAQDTTSSVMLSVDDRAKAEAMGALMFQTFQAQQAELAIAAGTITAPAAIAPSESTASLAELLAAGKVYKSTEAHILEVAKLGLPLTKASATLKLLAAAGDASFSQSVASLPMSSKAVLDSESGTSSDSDGIFSKVLGIVTKKA